MLGVELTSTQNRGSPTLPVGRGGDMLLAFNGTASQTADPQGSLRDPEILEWLKPSPIDPFRGLHMVLVGRQMTTDCSTTDRLGDQTGRRLALNSRSTMATMRSLMGSLVPFKILVLRQQRRCH